MNSNAKFTGFSPEELAAAEHLSESADLLKQIVENESVKEELAKQGLEVDKEKFNEFMDKVKSPENGQSYTGLAGTVVDANTGQTLKPLKKHKKKKMSLADIIAQSQKIPELQSIYYDKAIIPNLKANTWGVPPGEFDPVTGHVGSPSEAFPDQNPLSKADIQKAALQAAQNAQVNAQMDAITYYSTPGTVAMTAPNSYQTYIFGKDAVFEYPSPIENGLQQENKYLRAQIEDYKEIVKQLSGEPGEFIYIHPFDLYELINSFVIPVSLNVDKECKELGYIEINGKKYKQSTLMPITSKNSVVYYPGLQEKAITPPTTKFEKEYPW